MLDLKEGLAGEMKPPWKWEFVTRLWTWWSWPFARTPAWMVSPKPDPAPEAPNSLHPQAGVAFIEQYKLEIEAFRRAEDERKSQHDEASKTIRRVFHTLVGTCVFCVITLGGSPDLQLLTPDAEVELPGINYKVNFANFLFLGPAILLGLVVYLHIFLAHKRKFYVPAESSIPALFNMSGRAAKLVTWILFYWMVPLTLAFFTWKALPRPELGKPLFFMTFAVTAGMLWLQVRRCPWNWRPWATPLLLGLLIIFANVTWDVAAGQLTAGRSLNLFKAKLIEADLRGLNLKEAFLQEADLSKANLSRANLTEADLSGADLGEANLFGADLGEANLSGADLSGATLRGANLSGAILGDADLSRADLGGAILIKANLRGATLRGADLSRAILIEANLNGADLGEANLSGAILVDADLSRAYLKTVEGLTQIQLDGACGDENTKLPDGLSIKACE